MDEPGVHEVRPARAGDLRQLAAVEESGEAQYAAHLGEERMVQALRDPAPTGLRRDAVPGFILVSGSPVVGFVHVIELDGAAHLEQVSVRPGAQRAGLGTALVRAAMQDAERAGHAALSLCTYRDVPWNAPFYARLGFTEVTDLLPYQVRLREVETVLGLDDAGPRVVMSVALSPEHPLPAPVGARQDHAAPQDPFAVHPPVPEADARTGVDEPPGWTPVTGPATPPPPPGAGPAAGPSAGPSAGPTA